MNSKRAAVSAVLGVATIVLIPILALSGNPPTARAEEEVPALPLTCVLQVSGSLGVVVCGGEVVDQLNLPTIQVPGPTQRITIPVTLPPITQTIRIPGPTVRLPGETVTIPGLGATATVTATQTVTRNPQGSEGPIGRPVETITVEVTPSDSPSTLSPGQTPTESVTIRPEPKDPEVRTRTEEIVRNVLVGTIVTVALALLGIIALVLGYKFGYGDGRKNMEKDEVAFLRSLLPKRGKHQ